MAVSRPARQGLQHTYASHGPGAPDIGPSYAVAPKRAKPAPVVPTRIQSHQLRDFKPEYIDTADIIVPKQRMHPVNPNFSSHKAQQQIATPPGQPTPIQGSQQAKQCRLAKQHSNSNGRSLATTTVYDKRHRVGPGSGFFNAGIPSGLWVVPLEAAADPQNTPPPVAPGDPQELLRVLQNMPPPNRKIVIFKAGGYVYSDMEALIEQSRLQQVFRLTNLIRKATCVLGKPIWDSGKRVNLLEHQAAARKAKIPFLTISKLDPIDLVDVMRPLLIKRKLVLPPQQPG